MDRIEWDIQQILRDLYELPRALVDRTSETGFTAPLNGPVTNAHSSAHRRALRHLDRSLQQIEQLQQQYQQRMTSATSEVGGEALQESITMATTVGLPRESLMDSQTIDSSVPREDPQVPFTQRLHQESTSSGSEHGHHARLSQQSLPSHPNPTVPDKTTDAGSKHCLPRELPYENPLRAGPISAVTLVIPSSLQKHLRMLLARLHVDLAMPQQAYSHDFGIDSLAALVLERSAKVLFFQMDGQEKIELSFDDVIEILHRLHESCGAVADRSNSSNTIAIHKACLTRLCSVNQYFMRAQEMKEKGTYHNEGGFNDSRHELLPAWATILFLPNFLSTAIPAVQNISWEHRVVVEVDTEMHVQWRILTGYLIERTIHLEQEDSAKGNAPSAGEGSHVQDWLFDWFRYEWAHESSIETSNRVRNFLEDLILYGMHFSDYALDSLDGATVLFSSTATPTFLLPMEASQSHIVHDRLKETEDAIQDSLRQVNLATNLLVAIGSWCITDSVEKIKAQVDSKKAAIHRLTTLQHSKLTSLWTTMVSVFMERSTMTTALNYIRYSQKDYESGGEGDLEAQICYLQLKLADLVLSLPPKQDIDVSDTFTLALERPVRLTFLRALTFPCMLLAVDKVWEDIAERLLDCQQPSPAPGNIALKRTLQAAVLTLCQQYMIPAAAGSTHGDNDMMISRTESQENVQALLNRLLPLMTPKAHKQSEKADEIDPWDKFFHSRLGL